HLFKRELAVEVGGRGAIGRNWPAFARQRHGLLTLAGEVSGKRNGELPPGSVVAKREIDMIVNRARLFLEKVGDGDAAIVDFEETERESLLTGRSRRRAGVAKRREIPNAIRIADQLNRGFAHGERVDLYLFSKKRQQTDANRQLLHGGERLGRMK